MGRKGDYCFGGAPQDVAWSRGSCSVFSTPDEAHITGHGRRYGCLPLVLENNPKRTVEIEKKITSSRFAKCALIFLFAAF